MRGTAPYTVQYNEVETGNVFVFRGDLSVSITPIGRAIMTSGILDRTKKLSIWREFVHARRQYRHDQEIAAIQRWANGG